MIRFSAQETSVPVEFAIKDVDANVNELADSPIVIMTGMSEPKLTDAQVDATSRHLQAGGFLFINNTSWSSPCSTCPRGQGSLVRRIYPDQKLAPLPADHEVGSHSPLPDRQDAATRGPWPSRPARNSRRVTIDGRTPIIYSKNDTLAMLKGVHDPYANAYDAPDGPQAAGSNILCYAMSK